MMDCLADAWREHATVLVRLLGHCRLGLGLVMGFLVGRVQGFLRIPFGFETAWRSGQEFSMRGRGENLYGLGEDRAVTFTFLACISYINHKKII